MPVCRVGSFGEAGIDVVHQVFLQHASGEHQTSQNWPGLENEILPCSEAEFKGSLNQGQATEMR